VSKAYDQLAAALRGVKESAAQLDQVEKMLKDLLQPDIALLSMTDSIFSCAKLWLCLCYIDNSGLR